MFGTFIEVPYIKNTLYENGLCPNVLHNKFLKPTMTVPSILFVAALVNIS